MWFGDSVVWWFGGVLVLATPGPVGPDQTKPDQARAERPDAPDPDQTRLGSMEAGLETKFETSLGSTRSAGVAELFWELSLKHALGAGTMLALAALDPTARNRNLKQTSWCAFDV